MNAFNKVIRIGTININGRAEHIHCKIEFTGAKLSISGVIGAQRGGNAAGGCGQINMEFAHRNTRDNDIRYSHLIEPKDISFAPVWNAENLYTFLDIWGRWHFNDMKAGSKVQEDYLRENPIDQREYAYPKSYYEVASAYLTNAGLNPDPDGYKYGHAWKYEDVDQSALDFLRALPSADILPAWV